MKIALLRVAIDTGSGGMHGPLFKDGSFEHIPIPDLDGVGEWTYSTMMGRYGRPFVEYFRTDYRRLQMANRRIHHDPEFETFTYGDPTTPKSGLKNLQPGDMLVFYCGLEGCDFKCGPGLYLMGYFEVEAAGLAKDFADQELQRLFGQNFHVKHTMLLEQQRNRLVLVKGSSKSRLLKKAVLISSTGKDRSGGSLKILSPEMQLIFGEFDGKTSIQRSPPRMVDPAYVEKAAAFIRSLE